MPLSIAELESLIRTEGFNHFGFTKLQKPLSFSIYQNWVEAGMHGEMNYLKEHLPKKENPRTLIPQAKSAIVLAIPYLPHPEPIKSPLKAAKIAYYAQGEDYHFWIKKRLQLLVEKIQNLLPDDQFMIFTDSGPVLERDLAFQAGLGWFGKNTCLLDRKKGSLFFLAEIITSLELTAQNQAAKDMCGTCTRCIEACPTGALTQPQQLDARLCISYWTIESKKTPPLDLRHKIGDWFFGCDICQTVCPWNEKIFGPALKSLEPSAENLEEDLTWILTSSNKALERAFKQSPLLRAGAKGLKRNALIVVANKKLRKLLPTLEELSFKDPQLEDLRIWSIKQL